MIILLLLTTGIIIGIILAIREHKLYQREYILKNKNIPLSKYNAEKQDNAEV